MFKIFVNKIKNQISIKIKRFRSDRGTQYESNLFNELYNMHIFPLKES